MASRVVRHAISPLALKRASVAKCNLVRVAQMASRRRSRIFLPSGVLTWRTSPSVSGAISRYRSRLSSWRSSAGNVTLNPSPPPRPVWPACPSGRAGGNGTSTRTGSADRRTARTSDEGRSGRSRAATLPRSWPDGTRHGRPAAHRAFGMPPASLALVQVIGEFLACAKSQEPALIRTVLEIIRHSGILPIKSLRNCLYEPTTLCYKPLVDFTGERRSRRRAERRTNGTRIE
jgi:hypothetical protein